MVNALRIVNILCVVFLVRPGPLGGVHDLNSLHYARLMQVVPMICLKPPYMINLGLIILHFGGWPSSMFEKHEVDHEDR